MGEIKLETLREQIRQLMIESINQVINGTIDSIELPYIRPGDVIQYIVSIGGNDCENFDTNGWQWDYWMDVELNGKVYTLAGDGFYGNSANFSLKKKNEYV